MLEETIRTETRLQGSEWLENEDERTWKTYLNYGRPSPPYGREVIILDRVVASLHMQDYLVKSVRTLTRLIDALDTPLRLRQYYAEPRHSTDVACVVRLGMWDSKTFSDAIALELHRMSSPGQSLALLLWLPGNLDGQGCLWPEDIDIGFVALGTEESKSSVVNVHFTATIRHDVVVPLVQRSTSSTLDQVAEVLGSLESRPPKESYFHRASFALSIAAWTFRLWFSSSTGNLATDRIRLVKLTGNPHHVPAVVDHNDKTLVQRLPQALLGLRYLLLAIVLAEIALARRIDMEYDAKGASLKFIIDDDDEPEGVEQGALVAEVRRATVGHYEMAVWRCLGEDENEYDPDTLGRTSQANRHSGSEPDS